MNEMNKQERSLLLTIISSHREQKHNLFYITNRFIDIKYYVHIIQIIKQNKEGKLNNYMIIYYYIST